MFQKQKKQTKNIYSIQFFCFEVFNIKKISIAIEIKIIETNKLKLLTCILFKPQENIIAVAIIIISQWIGFPIKILFMS